MKEGDSGVEGRERGWMGNIEIKLEEDRDSGRRKREKDDLEGEAKRNGEEK